MLNWLQVINTSFSPKYNFLNKVESLVLQEENIYHK